jgi:hypothetical protein
MGMASIRYCSRVAMKYEAGLQFNNAFLLSNPVRKAILEKVLRQNDDSSKPGGGD